MKNFLKFIVGTGLFLIPGLVQAQELTLRVEPGVAAPLSSPQSNRFNVGGDVMIKPTIGLTSWLDLDPSVGLLALSNSDNYKQMGTAWMFGGGLRAKRPHDNKGEGVSAVSPWVDADLQYVRTGELDRFGWNAAVGAAWPTSEERGLWVGPFLRYQSVYDQDGKLGMNTNDAKVLVAGVSFEFGPEKKKPVTPPITMKLTVPVCPDRDHDGLPDGVDRCPDVAGPIDNFGCPRPLTAPAPVVVPKLTQVIHFNLDSAKLDSTAMKALDQAVEKMKGHDYQTVVVEGHASSEGPLPRNQVLADQRAKAVVDYLVSKGVSRSALVAKGFGVSKPAETNRTKEGRELNRRAEFTVTFNVSK